jgi:hypothetical protein
MIEFYWDQAVFNNVRKISFRVIRKINFPPLAKNLKINLKIIKILLISAMKKLVLNV